MTQVQIITPRGMFGSYAGEDAVSTAMRIIGVGFAEDGEWAAKYGTNYENDVFAMRTFYWGDCDCGYEEREAEWCDSHEHSEECYQSALDKRRRQTGLWDTAAGWWKRDVDFDRYRREEDRIFRVLCNEYGLPYPNGCAVHCTCNHKPLWNDWIKENGHNPTCSLELPNFRHKPTGLEVRWYKYIGRDMEIKGSGNLGEIMESVFASHPQGMTFEQATEKTAKQEDESAKAFAAMFASLGVETGA